ncbi:hypothetical protein SAMN05444392_102318 [Seinonella peptonophila]|uniref:Acb2/Tad1 hairpin domain-containing protein n=1 Tax=Seinonella peptonophila TaxID=112248 RepID=A0A1M4VEJ4_9BACL|nr:hypothetical protein [Seinonella peptonophila]SHE67250.1 hypothetical protein SAMN05444392_102318 [Seinonella peptonophila]
MDKMQILKEESDKLMKVVIELLPNSREKSLTLTKLEEAVMWAAVCINKNEKIREGG